MASSWVRLSSGTTCGSSMPPSSAQPDTMASSKLELELELEPQLQLLVVSWP
jgi:hypothetical protein